MKRLLAILGLAAAIALGTAAPAPAIVGGSDAVTNPGVVSIYTQNPDRNRCSGTLIDDGGAPESEWVLTAAHCWYPLNDPAAGFVEIRIGGVTNADGSGYITRSPIAYRWHPTFDPNTLVGDIMLIRLNAPVPVSVQKPAKYNIGSVSTGTLVHIAGYGWVCDGPPGLACSTWYEGALQRMTGKIVADSTCAPQNVVDPARQVCFVGAMSQPAMAGPGDSGTGGFIKDAFGNFVVKMTVVGDGDLNYGSVLYGPDGSPGLGMGMDVGAYGSWIFETVHADDFSAAAAPPALSADREYQLLYELVG